MKLQIEKKKGPIHPEILQNEDLSSRLKEGACSFGSCPPSAPTYILTEARSWASVASRMGHLYKNGHQACTSCCLTHCLSSSAGAQTPDYASQLFGGKRSATSTSNSQDDCSTSATETRLLEEWRAPYSEPQAPANCGAGADLQWQGEYLLALHCFASANIYRPGSNGPC